jgi:hypothetical protein
MTGMPAGRMLLQKIGLTAKIVLILSDQAAGW